ncbi:MAG: cupin domain-containing protein [Acetobacteraceae bacterium]
MHLNADFGRRAAVHAATLEWVASPMEGVHRRMLDRVGGEVARATSIVRYAPDSHFSPHVHDGGEEFLVLDGMFQDEHGDYPAGSYVRNPPTSRHTPGSAIGCTIFVKLWQFDLADRTQVRIATTDRAFIAADGRAGVSLLPLFQDAVEQVRLEQWEPDARVAIPAAAGLELLVLAGSFTERDERFTTLSWLRLPPGAAFFSGTAGPAGCRAWVKSGHLAAPRGIQRAD